MNDTSVQVSCWKAPGKHQPHKDKGPDEIHGRVLKECQTNIAPIFFHDI